MPLKWLAICLACTLAVGEARHHYIGLNLDDIDFLDLTPHKRVPRGYQEVPATVLRRPVKQHHVASQSPFESPQRGIRHEDVQAAASNFFQNAGNYIDFGAHTGNSGAFGWYADYPVRRK